MASHDNNQTDHMSEKVEPPAAIKDIVQRVKNGAVGYVNATLGRNLAPENVIELRRKICGLCEKNSPCVYSAKNRCCGPMMSIMRGGPECGCVIEKKTSLAAESCPNNHWDVCMEAED